MKVRHAVLEDVLGSAKTFGGVSFVPAVVRLDGTSFSTSFPLREIDRAKVPPILRAPIDNGYDVSWVYARMPNAFGIEPEQSGTEKTLLEEGFVAVIAGQKDGIAFICTDYYGKTSLMFSDDETDERSKAKVAEAFWGLLLTEPEALTDFEASVMHMGASVYLNFGCKDGEPIFCESETSDGDPMGM
jgi:hypothetical protein